MRVTLEVPDSVVAFARWYLECKGFTTLEASLQDMLRVSVGRLSALLKYAGKRADDDATFRPYRPLKLDEIEREKVAEAAQAAGIAPVRDPRARQCAERDQRGVRCTLAKHSTGSHSF